ncbi:interleukin-21 receptor-like [Polyodon spathula]|uniref:interleukin-21 receptor-like n=1 Tax=Polyodon spathula TaxID=7913 RepID=UPI001B7E5758|nr:interleukin-21 receptor-like [Polyodon spathula]XP_041133188.1 interleukin-21 receptor-like [Polyodon spathula]
MLFSQHLLLFMSCVAGFPSATKRLTKKPDLTCLNNYLQTVSCTLTVNKWRNSEEENATVILEFKLLILDDDSPVQCTLVKEAESFDRVSYSCSLDFEDEIISEDKYEISLRRQFNGTIENTVADTCYRPSLHIKPLRPVNLSVTLSSNQYNFTWDTGYPDDHYLDNQLQFELSYRKKEDTLHSKENVLPRANSMRFIDLKAPFLEADTVYIAKVRSAPNNISYMGHWSEWSQPVELKTGVLAEKKSDIIIIIGSIVMPLLLAAVILVSLYFNLPTRFKCVLFTKIPTPEPFFQPLYSNHKGNFRNWLSHQGDPLRKEEELKIDSLVQTKQAKIEDSFFLCTQEEVLNHITNIKPIHREWSCSAKHSNGADCKGSQDVASDIASSPLAALPKSLQSYDEMFSTLSLDLAGVTDSDSGCDDMTRSPDSSWQQATFSFELPPEPESLCYSDDYCTLSDTNNGLIPTKMIRQVVKSVQSLADSCPLAAESGDDSSDPQDSQNEYDPEYNSYSECLTDSSFSPRSLFQKHSSAL